MTVADSMKKLAEKYGSVNDIERLGEEIGLKAADKNLAAQLAGALYLSRVGVDPNHAGHEKTATTLLACFDEIFDELQRRRSGH